MVDTSIGDALLAVNGGVPLRTKPFPGRKLFAEEELGFVAKVFEDSWQRGVDFGFQGKFEELYTNAFCEFQGGGYADAVASGTAALFIALATLGLDKGSEVIFSPVTDPGGIAPALMLGFTPVVADSAPGSFNIDLAEFKKAISRKTRAAVITHLGGIPVDMDPIMEFARSKGILVIEDCSQAHGALCRGKKVGRFGDMAIFSTMFSKMHATGGCGGLVFSEKLEYHRRARSLADRGKAFFDDDFNPKDPGKNLFAALNLNQDELSCAIGLSTLGKLERMIEKRLDIMGKINKGIESCEAVYPIETPDYVVLSPFFITVGVDETKLTVSKKCFAEALVAEGLWVNPDYKFVVSEWDWIQKYIPRGTKTPNATSFREKTFNILFNERFGDGDVSDIVEGILKVERVLTA